MTKLGRCLLLLLSCAFSAAVPAEQTRLTAARPVVWRDFLGVNAHFLWFTPAQYQGQIQQLKALGLEWVRVDLHWDRHEPKENQFVFAPLDQLVDTLKARQLKSVFYLVGSAPSPAARCRCSAPATSFRQGQQGVRQAHGHAGQALSGSGRLAGVERAQSARLLAAAAQPGRLWPPAAGQRGSAAQRRPGKPVVMAGMAYYSQMPVRGGLMLEELGKKGGLDLGAIVAYHPYSQQPEGDDPKARDFVLRAQQINARLRQVKAPAIWATEWGWSSYGGPKEEQELIGRDGQADYLLRRLALMSALDYDRIFLFALSDLDQRASVRDRGYGLWTLPASPNRPTRRWRASSPPPVPS